MAMGNIELFQGHRQPVLRGLRIRPLESVKVRVQHILLELEPHSEGWRDPGYKGPMSET